MGPSTSHVRLGVRLSICAVGAGVLLGACAGLPGVHALTQVRSSESFETTKSLRSDGGAWPESDWISQIGGAQLARLSREALAANPDFLATRFRIAAAVAQAEGAHAALLPTLQANGSVSRGYQDQNLNLPTPVGPTPETDGWSNQLTGLLGLNYELDLWGKNRAALAQAVSQSKAAIAEGEQARLSLLVALAMSYTQLALQYETRDAVGSVLEQRQRQMKLAQARLDAGLDSPSEANDAGARVSLLRLQLQQIDERIELLRHQLGALLGKGPDRGMAIPRPRLAPLAPLAVPEQLPLHLLGRRPDVVAARWRVEAAARGVDVAKARFYPDINLSALAGYASFSLSNLGKSTLEGFTAGPAINLPIFEGGRLRANLNAQLAQYDASVAAYNGILNTALNDAADQITSLRAVDQQLHTQSDATDSSERGLELTRKRHSAGLLSDQMLASAELELLNARQRSIELQSRRRSLQIGLIRALGGGFDVGNVGIAFNSTQHEKKPVK